MESESKRVLISTWVFPPASSGTGIILYELLRHLPQEQMIAVHSLGYPPLLLGNSLDVEQSVFLVGGSAKWTVRLMRRAPQLLVPLIRRRIVRLARSHGVQRIYAHFPAACFVVAAWQAAKQLDLPLTVYFDILWEENYTGPAGALARKYEKRIFQYADRRFAITEFAVEHLQKKHGVDVQLIPHLVDSSQIPSRPTQLLTDGPATMHFCGGIYEKMNKDSIFRMVKAVQMTKSHPVLDFCVPEMPAELLEQGIVGRYVNHKELRKAQQESTILYLPQAFSSPQPEMVRRNFPTKAMDYLVSGRPILVHSPSDSYLTYLARREGFALVVDRPDQSELAEAIDRLIEDQELQRQVVDRGLTFAKSRDSRVWAQELWQAMGGERRLPV